MTNTQAHAKKELEIQSTEHKDIMEFVGGTYIIEPDNSIRNEVYDYTHFVAQEIQLVLIDE